MKAEQYSKAANVIRAWFLIIVFVTGSVNVIKGQVCNTTTNAVYYPYSWRGQTGFFHQSNAGGYFFGFMKDERQRLLTRIDDNGNIIWSNLYSYTGSRNILNTFQYSNAVEDNNGNYFVDIQEEAFALLNPQGGIIATKHLKGGLPISEQTSIHSLAVLPDNRKLVFLRDLSGLQEYSYAVVCLSADISTILWTKHLSQFQFYGHNMTYNQGKLYLLGATNQTTDTRAIVITLDANTGDLISQVKYISGEPGGTIFFRNIYRFNDGFILAGVSNIQGGYRHCFIRTDIDFNIKSSFYITTPTQMSGNFQPYDVPLFVDPGGGFYGAVTFPFGHNKFYISATDSMIWNRYYMLSGDGNLFGLTKTADQLVLFCKSEFPEVNNGIWTNSASLTKSTLTGIFSSCTEAPVNLEKQTFLISATSSDIEVRDTVLFTIEDLNGLVEANSFVPQIPCNGISTCSVVAVQGPSAVCTAAPVTFSALRNQQCYTSIEWQVIGGNAVLTAFNDTAVHIQFQQPGSYKIIATLQVSCSHIADTLEVQVQTLSPVLDIGPPDSALCSNVTDIRLNAGSGFVSYIWQDGSTSPVYDVTTPGLYHVTVKDQCNQEYRDTILIYAATTPPLNIGGSRDVCAGDTLHFIASAGFAAYSWEPVNEIHGQGQQVYVIPRNNLRVSVAASTTEGCIARDTSNLHVLFAQVLNLGNDLDLCRGDTITLSVEDGLLNYLWSTGTTGHQLRIFDKGSYWIRALNSNGCYSRDTIEIKNLFDRPVPDLGSDMQLCEMETKMLDAGIYSSYLWNDNSVSRFLPIANTGRYWVTVRNSNNCRGSDTIDVIRKDCRQAVYLPNSFTPNGDGHNDIFKALTLAVIPDKFELFIFNNYGQLVYHTTDITHGWDGKYNGKLQPASGYVWRCVYQFKDKILNNETGTVLLIR